jgi:hypothetical protein
MLRERALIILCIEQQQNDLYVRKDYCFKKRTFAQLSGDGVAFRQSLADDGEAKFVFARA